MLTAILLGSVAAQPLPRGQWSNRRWVQPTNGFQTSLCSSCHLRSIKASSALDCGIRCTLMPGCKSAFWRRKDRACLMKRFTLEHPAMRTVVDRSQMQQGIKILLKQPNGNSAPKPKPTPKPAPKPAPAPNPRPGPRPGNVPTGNGQRPGDEDYSILPNGQQSSAIAMRFWDCAKPSCGYFGKADVTEPPRSCAQDGVTVRFAGYPFSGSYKCTNQMPFISKQDPDVAFAFGAWAAFSGGEARSCCTCLEIKFDEPELAGKTLVLQVVNSNNGDGLTRGKFVEIAVPGGGVGGANRCDEQWNAGSEWGAKYGGLKDNTCDRLPRQLSSGCNWQYNWLRDVGVPSIQYKEITCPKVLTDISGCIRK